MKYPTRRIYPPIVCKPPRLIRLTPEMLRRSHENMAKAKEAADRLTVLEGFRYDAMRDPRLPRDQCGRPHLGGVEKMAEVLRLECEYEALKKWVNAHTLTFQSAEDKKAIQNMRSRLVNAKKRLK